MKAFVITLTENEASTDAAMTLIRSNIEVGNEFTIHPFDASIPEHAEKEMTLYNLRWNWPWRQIENDFQSGLMKQPYLTANPNKRIACFLSHYRLWKHCAEENEDLIIFEHDAVFIKKLDLDLLSKCRYDIIGLNDPRKATRKSDLYHTTVQSKHGRVVDIPKIDFDSVAQGLAGNSAYYIKPSGAKKLLSLVKEYGAWPNDAIMCRQMMPRMLGQLKDYATKVQSIQSTTTL